MNVKTLINRYSRLLVIWLIYRYKNRQNYQNTHLPSESSCHQMLLHHTKDNMKRNFFLHCQNTLQRLCKYPTRKIYIISNIRSRPIKRNFFLLEICIRQENLNDFNSIKPSQRTKTICHWLHIGQIKQQYHSKILLGEN